MAMTKKSPHARKTASAPTCSTAPAPSAEGQGAAIRPVLTLADLVNSLDAGEAKSTHQQTLAQVAEERAGSHGALAAHRRRIDQVRASLLLPVMDLADVSEAGTFVRSAAAAEPVAEEPALSPPTAGQSGRALTTVASARDLGRLVREARESRKLSQQEFADLAGVGRRFISELENGKPTLEIGKVLQVAAATGIDVLARRRP